MTDTEELREVAAKATPGPWRVTWYGGGEREPASFVSASRSASRSGTVAALMTETGDGWGSENREADAEFIATFDPPTVLTLLDRLDAAEAAVERVRALADGWEREDAKWRDPDDTPLAIITELRAALEGK